MIASCGLDCETCEAYVATQKNDPAMRAQVAQKWTQTYNTTLTANDINCTGCQGSGVKFAYCEHMCPIRACARAKSFTTCAECDDYGCDKLQFVHKAVPDAQKQLDLLRQSK